MTIPERVARNIMRYDVSTKVRLLSKLSRSDEILVHKEMKKLMNVGEEEILQSQSGGEYE